MRIVEKKKAIQNDANLARTAGCSIDWDYAQSWVEITYADTSKNVYLKGEEADEFIEECVETARSVLARKGTDLFDDVFLAAAVRYMPTTKEAETTPAMPFLPKRSTIEYRQAELF